ncbi:DpnD/PcfM family protein [uncultured Psychrobacter sp.]|uniref:DpnD/PcfM family protein n=1 Tax=uncultured Psychrobacter sp. TaxID=259303 RepID=UPI0030DBDC52
MSNTTENTMKKFTITIKEVMEREIEVEAEDLDTAINNVRTRYEDEDIVLDSDDFTGVDIFDSNAE